VVEAYSVLSVRESRVSYDLTRKKNPDSYKPVSETQYNMENRRELRNKAGVTAKAAPLRGSYAEERLEQLKKERAKYNVNYLGYYQGGNPQKDRGAVRSKSLGNPGEFHQPQMHNFLNYAHQDTAFVTPEDALQFKHYMTSDIVDFQQTKPVHPTYYDRNMDYMKDR
jgi:hypothetical protein